MEDKKIITELKELHYDARQNNDKILLFILPPEKYAELKMSRYFRFQSSISPDGPLRFDNALISIDMNITEIQVYTESERRRHKEYEDVFNRYLGMNPEFTPHW